MTTPTVEEVRRQNWMAAVRKGETTAGLAEWKNRPRAIIKPSRTNANNYAIYWEDRNQFGHPEEKLVTVCMTWSGAKRAARKLERQHRRVREWNEANG